MQISHPQPYMATSITPRRSEPNSPVRPLSSYSYQSTIRQVAPSPDSLAERPKTLNSNPSPSHDPEPQLGQSSLRRQGRASPTKRPAQRNIKPAIGTADKTSKTRQDSDRPETPTPMTPAQLLGRYDPLIPFSTTLPPHYERNCRRHRKSGIPPPAFDFPPRSPIPTVSLPSPGTTPSILRRTSYYGLPQRAPRPQNAVQDVPEGMAGFAGIGLGFGPGPVESPSVPVGREKVGAGLAFGPYRTVDLAVDDLGEGMDKQRRYCCCTIM